MNLLWSRELCFILLVLIISCKRGQDDIAGNIQPKVESLSTYYQDSFSIKTTVVKYDPIRAISAYGLLVGHFDDPVTGEVTANGYTKFGILSSNYISSFGPNPFEDSIKLRIKFDGYFYGRKNLQFQTPLRISVHRLIDSIGGNTLYSTTNSLAYDPTSLCSFELPVTALGINVTLSDTLGREFLYNIDFSNLTNFENKFRGLAFINENNNTVRRITYSDIIVYYHNYYALNDLLISDSAVVVASFSNSISLGFNQIISDKSHSELYNLKPWGYDSIPTKKCYIQTNTGIYTKVEFPTLNQFKQSETSRLVIDKAELIINPDLSDSNYSQVPYIYAYLLTANRNIDTIPIGNGYAKNYFQNEVQTKATILDDALPLKAYYNPVLYKYVFPMTAYIQGILDGKVINTGLLIGSGNYEYYPNPVSSPSTFYPFPVVDRTVFYNNNKGIKLNIYYTPYK